ncbi:3620_t:CDS:2, partial [Gigaspora margarita]
SKKTFKNIQSKKANKEKTASLESTRSTSLSKSFSERFDNLGVNDNIIKDKVRRIENRLNDLEQKMDNGFDITNDKAFKENTIKGAVKALIEKAIYSKNSQIKLEAKN